MTQEELKQMLNLIISKCDNLINNNLYTADDFTQCNVEDIAEMCNLALDGKFGELPDLPSDLDEAAEEYCSDNSQLGATCRACFRDGAEWMAGQGVTEEYDVDEDGIYLDSDSLGICLMAWPPSELHCKEGDTLIIQMRKRKSSESLNEKEDD